MTVLTGGLAPAGAAQRSLDRLDDDRLAEPADPAVEERLERLRPFDGWDTRMRLILQIEGVGSGTPNPDGWAVSTSCRQAENLYRVLLTLNAAGLPVRDWTDIQTLEALQALEGRLRLPDDGQGEPTPRVTLTGSNAIPLPRNWGGIYLAGLLCTLRTLLRAQGMPASMDLKARIAHHARAERRDVSHRLFLKESYLEAAIALDAFARVAAGAGKARRSASLWLSARLLAIVADGSPRRGEARGADRSLVHENPLSLEPEYKIFIRAEASKVCRPRTLWITDPRAIRFLRELRAVAPDGPLFRKATGEAIVHLDSMLARGTTIALGQPARFNMLRRANAGSFASAADRAAQAAHSGLTLVDTTYHPTIRTEGRRRLAAGRARAREVALRDQAMPAPHR